MSKYISPWHLSLLYSLSSGHSWSGWHGADTSSVSFRVSYPEAQRSTISWHPNRCCSNPDWGLDNTPFTSQDRPPPGHCYDRHSRRNPMCKTVPTHSSPKNLSYAGPEFPQRLHRGLQITASLDRPVGLGGHHLKSSIFLVGT